jgi:hypothetical protein
MLDDGDCVGDKGRPWVRPAGGEERVQWSHATKTRFRVAAVVWLWFESGGRTPALANQGCVSSQLRREHLGEPFGDHHGRDVGVG